MGTRYQQLSLEDRCTIARLHGEGRSLRQIAAGVDCAPSTVSRELKRNVSHQKGYLPAYAEEQSRARFGLANARSWCQSCPEVPVIRWMSEQSLG